MPSPRKGSGRPVSLRGAQQFDRIFKSGIRLRSNYFRLIALANGHGAPRLGMIIAKRNFPKAVERNRLRRLLRESVAANCQLLGATDLIVTVDGKALGENKVKLREDMDLLWRKLSKRLDHQTSIATG